MTGVSREERNRERHTGRKRSCEDRGRDWSDAAASQGMPGAVRNWERPERTLPWSLRRKCGLANTFISDSQLPET